MEDRFRNIHNLRPIIAAMPYHDEFQRRVAELIGCPNGSLILEIGTGQGFTAEQILEINPTYLLQGLELNPDYTEKAKKNLKRFEGRFIIETRDALDYLKNPEFQYWGVASAFTLHNLTQEQRNESLEGIFSVLRPNGTFVNADKFGYDNPEVHKIEYEKQMRLLENLDSLENRRLFSGEDLTRLKEEWIAHYEQDNQPERIMRLKEYCRQLDHIGFQNVRVHEKENLGAIVTATKPSF